MNPHLQDLRDLLYQPPSTTIWRRICDRLDQIQEASSQTHSPPTPPNPTSTPFIALTYALHHLASWPDHLRHHHIGLHQDLTHRPIWWPAIRTLTVDCYSTWPHHEGPAFHTLLTSNALQNIHNLHLEDGELPPESFHTLFTSPSLRALRKLKLQGQPPYAALQTFATSPTPTHLKHLALHNAQLTPDAITPLLTSPKLQHLTTLQLPHSHIGPQGAIALARSSHLTRLKRLDLSHNHIGDAGVIALAASPHLRQLSELNLRNNRLTQASIKALFTLSNLPNLKRLTLSQNHLTDHDIQTIANSPHLMRTHCLDLSSNHIGSKGVAALSSSPYTAGLTLLDLSINPIGPKGTAALSQSCHLSQITALGLAKTGQTNKALRALASSPHLRALKHLDIRGNLRLTNPSIHHIASNAAAMTLQCLHHDDSTIDIFLFRDTNNAAIPQWDPSSPNQAAQPCPFCTQHNPQPTQFWR